MRSGSEVGHLPAGTGPDVCPVQFGSFEFIDKCFVVGTMGFGNDRTQFAYIVNLFHRKFGIRIGLHNLVSLLRLVSLVHEIEGYLVRGDHPVFAASFDDHIAKCHSLFHVEREHTGAVELHGLVSGTITTNVADDRKNQILGHQVWGKIPFKNEPQGWGSFYPKLTRPHDKPGIRVPDTGRKFTKSPGSTGMGVCTQEHLTWAGVAFLGESDVAYTFVFFAAHIIKVGQVLLFHKGPQDINIAVGHRVRSKDVVVWNNDHLFLVPDLGIATKIFVEYSNCTRPTDIVSHQDININPDVVARDYMLSLGMFCQDFLRQGHPRHNPLQFRFADFGYYKTIRPNPKPAVTMKPGRTFQIVTLGCKVNQYDSQYLRELLEHAGWVQSREGQSDLCLVNTCTVTHEADAKGRQAIRRLHGENPQADLVVMGCFATRDPASVSQLPGVRQVITDKDNLAEQLSHYGVVPHSGGISRFDDHQRAFVKVQDGCLLNCSYCIIPSVRPGMRSRSIPEITAEVERLVANGYQEVVLTGIHLGHYGLDLSKGKPKTEWSRLWHLIRALEDLPGDFRVRLSSLEAAEVREDFLKVLKESKKVAPHLHLCLQSGSDKVLSAMRRRYKRDSFLDHCQRVREVLDEPALTTDVIYGFPGESDEDFDQTVDLCEKAGFCKIHLFAYSPREGTDAANMTETVPPQVKAQRRQRLLEVESRLSRNFQNRLIGRILDVLVEQPLEGQPGMVRGTSCRSVQVAFRGRYESLKRGRFPIKVTTLVGNQLFGEPSETIGIKGNPEGSDSFSQSGPIIGKSKIPLIVF